MHTGSQVVALEKVQVDVDNSGVGFLGLQSPLELLDMGESCVGGGWKLGKPWDKFVESSLFSKKARTKKKGPYC